MSSKEALGILKNWSTARTCVSLKTMVASPRIRWDTKPITIESVDASSMKLATVDTREEKTVLLRNAEFSKISGNLGLLVRLESGDQFSLEVEPPA